MTNATEAERALFEDHMRRLGYSCKVSQFKPGYMGDNVQEAWGIWQAARAIPLAAAEPVKRRDVFAICDAYESGIGHGLKRDGHKSGAWCLVWNDASRAIAAMKGEQQ